MSNAVSNSDAWPRNPRAISELESAPTYSAARDELSLIVEAP
jgi:hypothetical protein